jgi:pimeloyl-ACP methyl ester carboxylesterase
LWGSLARAPRLHLIGHSFGAKLVTSIALAGARPESLTLLLAAFSAFAFAPEIPGFDRPGFYARVLAERRIAGPLVVLRSDHDTALGTFYRAVTGSGEIDRHGEAAPRRRSTRRARMAETEAASALGAVGARGVGAPELDLVNVQQTGIPRAPIVNVDGSRVVTASDFLLGAHRDIFHREVAALVAMAAGLIAGGPEGARQRPVDPRVDR